MTAKKAAAVVEATDTAVTETPEVAPSDLWQREQAMNSALSLAKNNGGMYQPDQIVKFAQTFLTFLKGEAQ
jgi:hypothetical protein